jgi:hypothetical protein
VEVAVEMLIMDEEKVAVPARKRNDKILRIQANFENVEKIQEEIIHMHRPHIANDTGSAAAPSYK